METEMNLLCFILPLIFTLLIIALLPLFASMRSSQISREEEKRRDD